MDVDAQSKRLLVAINELRSRGHEAWPRASPLAREPRLEAAARGHAHYLAGDNRLDHVDDRGRDGPMRVTDARYPWRMAGETIARGQPHADAVLASWRDSEGHLAVLMQPGYVHVGVALALPTALSGTVPAFPTYWVAVFASPAE